MVVCMPTRFPLGSGFQRKRTENVRESGDERPVEDRIRGPRYLSGLALPLERVRSAETGALRRLR
ncbi:hypothetical protein EEJ31_05295 [Cryobacterium tepidiphilum]|uniref:Uncharacterized protein n=1 Tax=Cryobacterium tepidiphilum TaxID=2486026 RepID=A0A3M8LEJ9_9MICO|nr:hypothetical protein EEJ31_05295 [Cryobacterium tepidiphilum]